MAEAQDEAGAVRAAIRELKGWVISEIVLLVLLLLFSYHLSREVSKVSYLKAQYEQQKVHLYELDNRLTQAEIDLTARLITLEKDHERVP